MRLKILGVNIDKISLPEVLDKISELIAGESQHLIVTINPEFIVEAQKNQGFAKALNSATIATCDGAGLQWAARFLYGESIPRVTGVDLVQELLKSKAGDNKIFLLGGAEGVAAELRKKYPRNIVGAESGGRLNKVKESWILEDHDNIIKRINDSDANIILVAFGQVKQENWIKDNLPLMPSAKVGIGIGGTFDYLTGKVKRPPAWMREAGLEWLYRLIVMPRRVGRIYNATMKFTWMVLREKFKKTK